MKLNEIGDFLSPKGKEKNSDRFIPNRVSSNVYNLFMS
jgi:hypothetical protein